MDFIGKNENIHTLLSCIKHACLYFAKAEMTKIIIAKSQEGPQQPSSDATSEHVI